jgi:hypothetical protein
MGPGIGGGSRGVMGSETSEVRLIEFAGICLVDCQTGYDLPMNASSIRISRGSMTFVTESSPLFGRAPSNIGNFELVICYLRGTVKESEKLSSLEGPFLHIGEVQIPSSVMDSWTLCIETIESTRCIVNVSAFVGSLVFRGSLNHDYRFPVTVDGVSGYLQKADRRTVFPLRLEYSFVDVLLFITASATRSASATCVFHSSTMLGLTGLSGFESSSGLPSHSSGLLGLGISIEDERSEEFVSSGLVQSDFIFLSVALVSPKAVGAANSVWWSDEIESLASFVSEICFTNRVFVSDGADKFSTMRSGVSAVGILSDCLTGSRGRRSWSFGRSDCFRFMNVAFESGQLLRNDRSLGLIASVIFESWHMGGMLNRVDF